MKRRRVVQSPEHVLIELRPSGLGSRIGAFALDSAILAGALSLVGFVGALSPQAIRGLFVATVSFVVIWGYHVFFEVLWNGQTPGKRIFRIRVVDGRGLPVDLAQSMVRNVVRILDLVPLGGVGLLAALLDAEHRRLGDRAADTLVVAEEQPVLPQSAALGARRFNSLRTPRLVRLVEHRLGLEERELLFALCLRAPRLSERARYELFEQVGEHYRAALGIDDPHLHGESIVRGIAALCAGVPAPDTHPAPPAA
jgi:uncharacterized RDD family membrane protein YckC